MKTPLLISILALTCAAGCTSHTERTQAPIIRELPPQSFTPTWTANLNLSDSNPATAMYVRDEQLFVYSKDHTSHVIARRGGQLQHIEKVQTIATVAPPLLLGEQIVYPTNTTLEVFDTKGKHVRRVNLPASMRSSGAAGVNDLVILGTDNSRGGRVVAMDLTREYDTPRWELMTGGGVSSAPVIMQGILYAASEDGGVYAVNRERTSVWPTPGGVFSTDGPILADLVIDEYGVYVASTDGKLYCLGRSDGKIRWQYFASTQLTVAPVATADSVYQYVEGEGILAISKTEGEYNRTPKWKVGSARSFLAEDKTYAYLRSKDNRVLAVERSSGNVKFKSESRFDIFGGNTSDGAIYVGKKDGTIYSLVPVLAPGKTGEMVFAPVQVNGVVSN